MSAVLSEEVSILPGGADDLGHLQIDLFETMEPLAAEWQTLQADNRNSLHQGYDWCKAWVETHRHPLAILRGRIGGETRFILPLEIQRHNMVRVAQFIAGRFSNINTGLFAPEAWDESGPFVPDDITRHLASALVGRADLISLANVPFHWRGSRHPLSALPASEHLNHSFQLPLLEDFDATINQLNGKRRRKKFRSQVRKIEATGSFEHLIARTASEKQELLSLFFHQKAIRFKALGLPNVFQSAETQTFFQAALQMSDAGGDAALELHGLRLHGQHEGAVAAIAGLSRKGDHVICQFGSIDESVAPEASPGELLFWLIIERACAQGAALFDFGLGDQDYKRRWCTIETVQHDMLLPVSRLGSMAAIAQRGVNRGKAAIKGNPHLYALIQRLRAQTSERSSPERDD